MRLPLWVQTLVDDERRRRVEERARRYADAFRPELEIRPLEDRRVLSVSIDPATTGDIGGNEGQNVNIAVEFSDDTTDPHTATIDWGDGNNTVVVLADLTEPAGGMPGEIRGTHTYDDDGNYTISVTITDSVDANDTATAMIDAAIANVAPVVGINVDTATPREGVQVDLSSTATDAAGDQGSLTYSWVIRDAGNNIVHTDTTAATSFTPTTSGTFSAELTVTDKDMASTVETQAFGVQNDAPVLAAPSLDLTSINEGGGVTLSGSFTDANPNDTHTVTIDWGDGSGVQTLTVAEFTQAAGGGSYSVSHTYADDPAGTPDDYTITVTVTDDNGNLDTDSSQVVTVANVAPVAPNPSLDLTTINEGGTVTLTGSLTDAGVDDTHTVVVDWGDGTSQTLTVAEFTQAAGGGSFAVSHTYDEDPVGTPDEYVIAVRVTDDDGSLTINDTQIVTVNNANPTVSIDAPPAAGTEGTAIALTATGSDAGGANDPLTYSWSVTKDGAAYDAGTGSSFSFTPDDEGSYVVTVTAADDDGGSGTDTATITVANAAPVVAAPTPAPATINEGGSVTLTGSFTDVGLSDTHTVQVDWGDGSGVQTLTVAEFTQAAGGGSYSVSHVYADDDADDQYTVTVTVTDNGGDVGSNTATVTVNNVAPTVSIDAPPATGNEGTAIALTVTGSDAGGANDPLTYSWSVTKNGAVYDAGSGSSFSFTPDDNGSYVVTVTADDGDGGTATDTSTIAVNNLNPTVSIDAPPATGNEGTAIALTTTGSDPAGANDPLTYSWSVTKNGVAYDAGSGSSFSFTPDDEGVYVVTVTADDGDGGTASDMATINVANDAPVVAAPVPTPATIDEGDSVTLTGAFTDAGLTDTHTVTVDWGDGSGVQTLTVAEFTQAAGGGTYSVSHTYADDDADDQYTITVTVTDNGGDAGSNTTTVTVNNLNPTVGIDAPPATGNEGSAIALTATGSDPGGANDPLTYSWSVTKNGAAYDAGSGSSFSFTPDDEGSYVVSVTATDGDGGTATDTATITVSNQAPVVGVPTSNQTTINEGQSITLTGAFTDSGLADTHTVVVDWGDGSPPQTLTVAAFTQAAGGGSYSVSHTYADDDADDQYTITVTVTDNGGDAGSNTTLQTVNNVAPTISIDAPPATANEGDLINLTTTAGDAGGAGDPLSYSWSVTKDGAAYGSGTGSGFSFTPDDDGSYVVTVTVIDGDGGTATDTATITVGNQAPLVAAPTPAPATINEGGGVTLTGTFTDAGLADTHTVTVDWGDGSPPQTLTVAEFTQAAGGGSYAVSHTYADDDADDQYTITVTVTDDNGGVASNTSIVTVNNVAPTVTIDGAPANSPEGTAITLGSTVTDPGGANDPPAYSWSVTKNGAAYDTGSGSSFTFTPDDNGTYVVTLVVGDGDGGTGSDSATITVTNVNPTVGFILPGTVDEGISILVDSLIADAGSNDTFTNYNWTIRDPSNAVVATGTGTDITYTPPDNGTYTVELTVDDNDGGTGTGSTTFTVNNVAPGVAQPTLNLNVVNEGDTVTLDGVFGDPGVLDTHTVVINWGDGSPPQALTAAEFAQAAGGGSFTVTHLYADDPAGTPDVYTITVTVTDNDADAGLNSGRTIVVNNVVPVITGVTNTGVDPNGMVTITGTVADVGQNDSHVAVITWGDGTTSTVPVTGGPGGGTFTATHQFIGNPNQSNPSADIPISITVMDNDGGQVTQGLNATVPGTGLFTPSITVQTDIPSVVIAPPPVVDAPVPNDAVADAAQQAEAPQTTSSPATPNETRLLLVLVSPTGEEIREFDLELDVLNQLPGWYGRLPDNHYRIYLIREDGSRVKVSDVVLRQGQPVDPNDAFQHGGFGEDSAAAGPEAVVDRALAKLQALDALDRAWAEWSPPEQLAPNAEYRTDRLEPAELEDAMQESAGPLLTAGQAKE